MKKQPLYDKLLFKNRSRIEMNRYQDELIELKKLLKQLLQEQHENYSYLKTRIDLLEDKIKDDQNDIDMQQESIALETTIVEKDEPEQPKQLIAKEVIQDIIEDTVIDSVTETIPLNWIFTYMNTLREAGKLPLFLMIGTGIITLLIGFIFFLQFAFTHLLNPMGKTALGFIVGTIFITLGKKLIKREDLHPLSQGLIALGITLNYITIYFIATFYHIIPPEGGLILILFNTLLASWLTVHLKTKVIAIVTLIGGLFTPFYLTDVTSFLPFFLGYILLISLNMNLLSHLTRWPLLLLLTFSSVATIFLSLPVDTVPLLSIIIIHIIVYINLTQIGLTYLKKNMIPIPVVIIIGGTITFLFSALILVAPSHAGYIVAGNSIVALLMTIILFQKLIGYLKPVTILFTATLILLSTILLISHRFLGPIWAAEGILLILMGFMFQFKSIRIKGYIILTLIFLKIIPEIIIIDQMMILFHLITIVITTLLLTAIFHRYSDESAPIEAILFQITKEMILPLTLLTIVSTLYIFLGFNWFILLPLLIFPALYIGFKYHLDLGNWFTFKYYYLLLFPVIISIEHVHSLLFSDQTISGKIAIVELFVMLWAYHPFLNHFFPEKAHPKKAVWSYIIFFFILPFTPLQPVFRHAQEWLPIAIWGSVLISFLLMKRYQFKLLSFNRYLTTAIALILSWGMFLLKPASSINMISPLAGALLLFLVIIFEKIYSEKGYKRSLFNHFATLFSLHVTVVLVIYSETYQHAPLMGISTAIIWLFILLKSPLYYPKSHYKIHIIPALILWGFLIANLTDQQYTPLLLPFTIIIPLLFCNILKKQPLFSLKELLEKGLPIALIFSGYLSFMFQITGDLYTPWLTLVIVLHALFLFFKGRNDLMITRTAFLLFGGALLKLFINDLDGESLFIKMAVLLLIGSVTLISAYYFSKYDQT